MGGEGVLMTQATITRGTLAYAQQQAREAAERYIAGEHYLAEVGMADWEAEAFLIEREQEAK